MQLFASSVKRAGNFASQGGLTAVTVPHISDKK